ncbi:MAG: hypothetical protein PHH54_01250 [Candidatus Nanoarchaeia archaeon]|nr:hypothetical protein [Candidatus Nanoarchaeia archaeon]MDD5740589.1 hypothetical protein [Candidatus Nanoarchaeia archaeon]
MKIIERNLQEIGKSLLVSLPKDWTRSLKLKKGSKIKMMVSEQGLLSIAPEFTISEKSKDTEIIYDENFKRLFFKEYFEGNEKITIIIREVSKKEKEKIYAFIKRFMNVQIIEETESKIVLKSFRIEDLSIEECLKRMYFLSLNMLEDTISEDYSSMKEMRDTMTRFYYMLVMQIRRFLSEGKFADENQIPLTRALDLRMVAEKIQRIGEIIESIKKIDKELIPISKSVEEYYSKSFNYFMQSDFKKALPLWEEANILNKKCERIKADKEKLKGVMQILRFAKEISMLVR